jgi:hypothetical protein
MMAGDRAALLQSIRAFCARHPTWVLFDEPSVALFEPATAKALSLKVSELQAVVERQNAQTGEPYLLLELGDGRELALCQAGIAFPPLAPSVPQAPELPQVVCLKDFAAAYAQLRHQALDHPDYRLDHTGLDLMVLALGILGGARRAGFEVTQEERELEAVLDVLEKRR